MRKKPSFSCSVACLASALIAMHHLPARGEEPVSAIAVTGTAKIRLPADEIVIYASIVTLAKTAADACKENRLKSQSLLDFLKSQKIEEQMVESDIIAISEIQPSRSTKGSSYGRAEDELFGEPGDGQSSSQRSGVIGYRAYRKFTIVVKDLTKFEEIYQGIVDKGVNRVDSVVPRSSQESQHSERLRKAAVRDARERAHSMASELGAKLSSIKSIANARVGSLSGSSRGVGMGPGGGMGGYGDDPFDHEASSRGAHITLETSVDIIFYLDNHEFKSK